MEITIEGNNQLRKLALLIIEAGRLGFDLSEYGYAAENENSDNVYIWLEDEPYCIFIGPCDDTIYASWSNPENGDEFETETAGKSAHDLDQWVCACESGTSAD